VHVPGEDITNANTGKGVVSEAIWAWLRTSDLVG